jgi:hypothetical protein
MQCKTIAILRAIATFAFFMLDSAGFDTPKLIREIAMVVKSRPTMDLLYSADRRQAFSCASVLIG